RNFLHAGARLREKRSTSAGARGQTTRSWSQTRRVHAPVTDLYVRAAAPAPAICSSSCDCTPDTPMAPTHSFWYMRGTPPCNGRNPGELVNDERSLMRTSPKFVCSRLRDYVTD